MKFQKNFWQTKHENYMKLLMLLVSRIFPLFSCLKTMPLHFTGCFYSTAVGETVGELRSYENPKNKITAVPAREEEIWGAKFMVK